MMGRFLKGKTLGAIVDDSDLCWRLGDAFMAVRKYTLGGRQIQKSTKMVICSTSRNTLVSFMNHLPPDSEAKLVEAPYPVVENVKCPRLRCLMMVACGCDVWPKGINGLGPAKLMKELEK